MQRCTKSLIVPNTDIKGNEQPEMNNSMSEVRRTAEWLCTTLHGLNTKCDEQAVALKEKDMLIATLSVNVTNAESALVAAREEIQVVLLNFAKFVKENKGESQSDCHSLNDSCANGANGANGAMVHVDHVYEAVTFTATCRPAPTMEDAVTKTTTRKLTRAEGGTGGRKRGKARVAMDVESNIENRDLSTVPFFKSLGVATAVQLQSVLTEWHNDKKGRLIGGQQLKTAYNQCKYKAEKFIRLVYFTGQDKYTPGDVDELFAFFNDKTHTDMCEDGPVFNHDHRVCKWFYFETVDSYESFRHKDNVYQARQARGFMTAVRAVYELYKIHTNKNEWPNWRAERAILESHQALGTVVEQPTAPTTHTIPLQKKRKRHSKAHTESESEWKSGSDSESGTDMDCMPQIEA